MRTRTTNLCFTERSGTGMQDSVNEAIRSRRSDDERRVGGFWGIRCYVSTPAAPHASSGSPAGRFKRPVPAGRSKYKILHFFFFPVDGDGYDHDMPLVPVAVPLTCPTDEAQYKCTTQRDRSCARIEVAFEAVGPSDRTIIIDCTWPPDRPDRRPPVAGNSRKVASSWRHQPHFNFLSFRPCQRGESCFNPRSSLGSQKRVFPNRRSPSRSCVQC